MYYIILIQNVPILDLRRPNHVLRTYTSVRDIKGWWNSTCNSKWVTQTTKANTRIFQNGNAPKLDILKKTCYPLLPFQKIVELHHKNCNSQVLPEASYLFKSKNKN